MRVHAVYRDLLAVPPGLPPAAFWSAFLRRCYKKHKAVFDGIVDAYGPELLGPNPLLNLTTYTGPICRAAIGRLVTAEPGAAEARCSQLLTECWPEAWGALPDCYLGTLFGLAPAAALHIGGRPGMLIGLERFLPGDTPDPTATPEAAARRTYHLSDLAEMIPHEACHVARARLLGQHLAPTHLPLLDLIMLEGTALWFTDARLGRQTLLTFLPQQEWERHQANEAELLAALRPHLGESGSAVFRRHFADGAAINGYYAGWAVCRRYLERQASDPVALTGLPSTAIWAGAGLEPPAA